MAIKENLVPCSICHRIRDVHNWNCPNKPLEKSPLKISVVSAAVTSAAVQATDEPTEEKRCECGRYPRQGHTYLCRMKAAGTPIDNTATAVALDGTQTSVTGALSPEKLQAMKDELAGKVPAAKRADDVDLSKKVKVNFPFVLIDHTTTATPDQMRPAQAFKAFISAWFEQLEGPWAAAYGAPLVSFRIGSVSDRKPNEIGVHFRDTIPEAPDALAYHQVVNGIPDIEIGVDLFDHLLVGSESVSSGGSHEILETVGDAGGNGWKDRQTSDGLMDAEEVCDFVQNTGYAASNGAEVSNFVLPNFFVPGSAGPWDHLGVMKHQYDYSNGYGILATQPGSESQVMARAHGAHVRTVVGNLTASQLRRKNHPYSRTRRRGVPHL